jgi:hypothetical protein
MFASQAAIAFHVRRGIVAAQSLGEFNQALCKLVELGLDGWFHDFEKKALPRMARMNTNEHELKTVRLSVSFIREYS